METLNKYIANIFAGLPDSSNKDVVIDKVLHDSQNKYNNLLSQGHSEAEALGIVFQQMDIDEIQRSIMSEPPTSQYNGQQQAFRDGYEPSKQQYDERQSFYRGYGPEMQQDNSQQTFQHGLPYQSAQQAPRSAAEQAEIDDFVSSFRRFQPRFAFGIAFGVVMCILSIVFAGLVSITWENQALTAAAFFGPIAVGVFFFIIFGMRYSSYMSYFRAKGMYEFLSVEEQEKLRKLEQQYRFTPADKAFKKERRREVLSSVLWLLTVVVYLLLGFLANLWHPGWIVFILAAALQTVISLVS